MICSIALGFEKMRSSLCFGGRLSVVFERLLLRGSERVGAGVLGSVVELDTGPLGGCTGEGVVVVVRDLMVVGAFLSLEMSREAMMYL